jgi:hypothetical protein
VNRAAKFQRIVPNSAVPRSHSVNTREGSERERAGESGVKFGNNNWHADGTIALIYFAKLCPIHAIIDFQSEI